MDTICPPLRWNMVEIGLSRGAYPVLRNFRHLSRMRLKTIVSLIPEPPSSDLVEFARMAGVELVYIQTVRTGPMAASLQQCLVQAINVCINEDRHPVYIHCLDGRRIAGLVVLFLRRIQGWTPVSAIAEFWRYQTAMRPTVPSNEIEKVSRELEKFASEFGEVTIPESIPRWLWGPDKNRNSAISGVKVRFSPPLTFREADQTSGSTGELNGTLKGNLTLAQERDRLACDYLSHLEQDEERLLRLGPGATKALQILRSHSNTPLHSGHTESNRNRMRSTVNTETPISRTLDALCLPGLETLSSRPIRSKKYFNENTGGGGGQGLQDNLRRARATITGAVREEYRSRGESRLSDCFQPLQDRDCEDRD